MLMKMFSYMHRHIMTYVIVIIICNCSQTYSTGTFSVIDNIDENGNIIVRNKYSAFDFGQEFNVDEILREIEDMGHWPGMIDQPFKKQSGEKCLDSCSASESSSSKVPEAGDNADYFQPLSQVKQTTKQNNVEILDDSTSNKSVYKDSKAPKVSVSNSESSSTSEVIEKIKGGNIDEILASLKKIAVFPAVSLDSSEDGEEDNNIVHGVHERSTGEEERSTAKMNSRVDKAMSESVDVAMPESVDEAMAESVSDILAPVKGERQARDFYHFETSTAFNTSVAFTIPLFSMTLPGSNDVSTDGLDSNVLATTAFATLFLLGALGVAIYTTAVQGAGTPLDESDSRSFNTNFPGEQLLLGNLDENLAKAVNSALLEVSEALDLPSCSQLATCEAYLRPKEYGVVGLPFRVKARLRPEAPSEDLSLLETAGRVGSEGGNCASEFPCIVDPLQKMEQVIDLLAGRFSR